MALFLGVLWQSVSPRRPQVVFKSTQTLHLLSGFNGEPPECSDVSDGIRSSVVVIFDEVRRQNHSCPTNTCSAMYSYSAITRDLPGDRINYSGQKVHIGSSKLFNEKFFISHMLHVFE